MPKFTIKETVEKEVEIPYFPYFTGNSFSCCCILSETKCIEVLITDNENANISVGEPRLYNVKNAEIDREDFYYKYHTALTIIDKFAKQRNNDTD